MMRRYLHAKMAKAVGATVVHHVCVLQLQVMNCSQRARPTWHSTLRLPRPWNYARAGNVLEYELEHVVRAGYVASDAVWPYTSTCQAPMYVSHVVPVGCRARARLRDHAHHETPCVSTEYVHNSYSLTA